MTNPRAEGLRVFRELLPGVIPDDDADVDFGGGFAPELMYIGVPDRLQQRSSDEELAEVVYHASGYAGFPAASTARNVTEKALAEDV